MARRLIISFLIFLACSSIYADDAPLLSNVYNENKSKCVFPFTYNGKNYTDCTTEGSNGDIAWCSVEAVYNGVFAYCYDMRKPKVKCLTNYTVNGKAYNGCSYLSKTAPYKQCKTSNPNYPLVYCPDAMNITNDDGLKPDPNCEPVYKQKSDHHTKWYVVTEKQISE